MLLLLAMWVIDSTVPALLIMLARYDLKATAGDGVPAAGCLFIASKRALLLDVNALLLPVARGDGLRLGGVACLVGVRSVSREAASMFFTMR